MCASTESDDSVEALHVQDVEENMSALATMIDWDSVPKNHSLPLGLKHPWLEQDEEIHRAANWLDEVVPGWEDRIVTESLAMMDHVNCIGGQLGIHWEKLTYAIQERYGQYSGAFCGGTGHWLREIEDRRRNRNGS